MSDFRIPQESEKEEKRQAFLRSLPYVLPVVLIGVMILLPFNRPRTTQQVLLLSPQYGKAKRVLVSTKYGPGYRRSPLPYLPRRIHLQSNGAKVTAYLLDLHAVKESEQISAFMTATEQAERGEKPTTAPLLRTETDVTRADFTLSRWSTHAWPGGNGYRYLLLVRSEQEAEVTVKVSY